MVMMSMCMFIVRTIVLVETPMHAKKSQCKKIKLCKFKEDNDKY